MRREARERAVQFLFQHDVNPPDNLAAAFEQFWEAQRIAALTDAQRKALMATPGALPQPTTEEEALRAFAEPLILGTIQHRAEIDALITGYAQNWDLRRMAVVDRNVLRLAIYEMLHREDIPPVVSINEAVDIAKKFSTEDSGRFVNGILDRVRQNLMRPARIAE